MSAALPEKVEALRAVATRREYQGRIALRQLPRLCEALANAEGQVEYRFEFGRDEFRIAYLDLELTGELPLVCQRTLEPFAWPLRLSQRMGLIQRESDEAGLPEGYEALLLMDGELALADVIQDEVLLALPLIPSKPGSDEHSEWIDDADAATETVTDNPFAALAGFKVKPDKT